MSDIVRDTEKFRRGWQGGMPETKCGAGSTLKATAAQRAWIPDMLVRYDIRSVADIGAGDLHWVMQMELPPGVRYQAYDLFEHARGVIKFDVLCDPLPDADMYWLLWVLNHFDAPQAAYAWQRILEHHVRYLLYTDRPRWRDDHPECLRDLPFVERLVLNKKQDAIMLIDLDELR